MAANKRRHRPLPNGLLVMSPWRENSLIAQFGRAATPNPADTICTSINVLSACFQRAGSTPAGCKKCFTTSNLCFCTG
ncbi:Uncharacterised protein [Vibrio cholerae]|uniref:Uncharacterized protein n=1 Tax=Vibrio cholerae TaxID=666 RepID=A0A655XBL1_VIBCL|nr:Uncharacterised protein [Vibrio cholerae]